MENPIKMDDLGIPLFSETPRWELYGQFIGTPPNGGLEASGSPDAVGRRPEIAKVKGLNSG